MRNSNELVITTLEEGEWSVFVVLCHTDQEGSLEGMDMTRYIAGDSSLNIQGLCFLSTANFSHLHQTLIRISIK